MNLAKLKLPIILLLLIAAGWLALSNRKNFHLVQNTKNIYRSAQLSTKNFLQIASQEKIDVVLNLRGESDKDWYINEKKISDELGIEYFTFGFSKFRTPSRERFLNILKVLDDVKVNNKKLLIHCKAGADRTGLISAVARNYLYGVPIDEAKKSLSLAYGHLPAPNGALEQVLSRYKEHEKSLDFKTWIEQYYDQEAIFDYSNEHRIFSL